MAEFLGAIPDENIYRDQAAAMLDMQNPGTTGYDREGRIQNLAASLRDIEIFQRSRIRATCIVKQGAGVNLEPIEGRDN